MGLVGKSGLQGRTTRVALLLVTQGVWGTGTKLGTFSFEAAAVPMGLLRLLRSPYSQYSKYGTL